MILYLNVFSNNQRKVSLGKCHLLMNVNMPATIKLVEHIAANSYCEKLIDVKIDRQLNFTSHIETIIKKAR